MEAGMVRYLGRDIHFPRGYGPRKDSSCWFTPGVICSGGEKHMNMYLYMWINMCTAKTGFNSYFSLPGVDLFSTISMFLGAITTLVFSVAVMYCIRYSLTLILEVL